MRFGVVYRPFPELRQKARHLRIWLQQIIQFSGIDFCPYPLYAYCGNHQ